MSTEGKVPLQPESVLVVDDEDEPREAAARELEADGFAVRRARSGFEAIELLKERGADVVVTDIVMKGMTGYDVLYHVRKASPETICIAMTGFGSLESALSALQAGAYSYLQKPWSSGELSHVVLRGVEKQRLTRELRQRNAQLEELNRQLDSKVQEATRELQALNERILTEMASLREVDQLKTSFLDSITHDLRNPMTSVVTAIACLRESSPGDPPERNKQILDTAYRAGSHLQYLIQQLVEAARLRSGKVRVELSPVPLSDILNDAMSLARAGEPAEKPRVELDAPPGLEVSVRTDKGRLLQVLGNLIGNARKFTPPDGRVTLRVLREGQELHWCVQDTGPGIEPRHLAHIFDRFFQIEGPARLPSSERGLGLGLSIAKDLVGLLGGRIWAESAPGKGASFHFTLPM